MDCFKVNQKFGDEVDRPIIHFQRFGQNQAIIAKQFKENEKATEVVNNEIAIRTTTLEDDPKDDIKIIRE